VLTGASGGIGEAIARLLVARGARVLLVARNADALGHLARSLASADEQRERVDALAVDVTDASDRVAIRDAAAARRVNVLINCAGLPWFGPFVAGDDPQIEEVIATNLLAPIQLTRALLPQLRIQSEARVLNIGSALGRIGLPGYSVYCASKFGLRGFSEALRRELADTPVRVQYLGPRTTRTAFNDARVEAYNRATATAADQPGRVADAALRLLVSGGAERFLGFPEAAAGRINGALPQLLDGAFKRHREVLRHQTLTSN
jgi:short-subunit dehydrogenase